jgi:serine phosphatase RsbU (regulator of sigma subunit)
MSDGVVEAQDSRGTLFGFERINEMLRQQATPREIATAAQEFGQEDDILVLQVWRDRKEVHEHRTEPEFAIP